MSTVPDCLRDADLTPTSLRNARTVPASFYTDEAMHRWDMREVLSRSWQFAAHANEVASAGDFVVRDIAGAPVLCVRGKDGRLRAFFNVCRHRAGPVASGSGNCALLRCGYHGWVYKLDGSLQHAPELGDIAGFDKAEYGLVALQVVEAGALCFVRRSDATSLPPGPDPISIMQRIERRVGAGKLAETHYRRAASYTVRCNWKVYVDNYLEGYHIPQVHPALAQALDYRAYTTETYDGYSLQHSRIETATAAYGEGEALYYFIFPNLMLNILPGRLQTNLVVPLAADRCRIDFVYYYDAQTAARLEQDVSFSDLVQREDVGICERVQQGLATGAYTSGRLSVANESGVHHWQEYYKSVCRTQQARVTASQKSMP